MMDKSSKIIERDEVVIRFSGDSGDGMQLTGTLFSNTSAVFGNDISTFPDYPAEIRAPQGTIAGVSGFQVHIGRSKVYTPGDYADVLIAMNPAALKVNAKWIKQGGTIIIDEDSFDAKNLDKAGYKSQDPISEDKLGDYKIIKAPITHLTKESLKDLGLDMKSMLRSKNMYALGIVYRLFNRPMEHTNNYIKTKFAKNPKVAEANLKVLREGYDYGLIIQAITPSYHIASAVLGKGKYRNINGNIATAWGLIAASKNANLNLFLGSYPITPATEILQELSQRKDMGVKVFQAEDEIAGICTAIGASFAGDLAVTSTSGPGMALKAEAIGLAVMAELPLVIINVQRGGPSTGLPTKTEQSDLMQALYGRSGESPCVVMAASTPTNCFDYAFYAAKIAVEHMTPVILLTDGFLANGTPTWKIPQLSDYPEIKPKRVAPEEDSWKPYQRDAESYVRSWVTPGTPKLMHRLGGLEKDEKTGSVSCDPENHEKMVKIREAKVKYLENEIPDQIILGNPNSDLLVIGWGGTFGHLFTAVEELTEEGLKIALAHFNYIKPLPKNTHEILKRYKKILVCELNLGQFANYLRMSHPEFNYHQYNKIQGLPFTVVELKKEIKKNLKK